MRLILENKLIDSSVLDILKQIRKEVMNGKLRDIVDKKANILVTCPFHKDGHENHPSCHVYADESGDLRLGEFNCFTCKEHGSFERFINACFDQEGSFAQEWLIERFGVIVQQENFLLPINLDRTQKLKLDEKMLEQYQYFHPYMFKRKLTENIIKKFKVGYDDKTQSIVFPVWDEHNNLVMLTKRSVIDKSFYIDKDTEKPVYLLNFILQENISTIYLVESQINALTLWTYNYPACALIGTGTTHQIDILNKSGIRHIILCFDGDEAGKKGMINLIKKLRKDIFISIKIMYPGKDVNDLDKETFDKLPIINSMDWLKSVI